MPEACVHNGELTEQRQLGDSVTQIRLRGGTGNNQEQSESGKLASSGLDPIERVSSTRPGRYRYANMLGVPVSIEPK